MTTTAPTPAGDAGGENDMTNPSLNDQVAMFAPMSKADIAICNLSIVRDVQALALPQHYFKIKAELHLRPEDSIPDIWLPVWTAEGMALVERLNAVDVPISRLFTVVVLRWRTTRQWNGASDAADA